MSDPVVNVGTSGASGNAGQDQVTAALESLAANARPVDDLIAEWAQDPEMRAEMAARDAVRRHGIVEVVVRNAIVQGPVMRSKKAFLDAGGSGFSQEFDDLDEARQFADEHKWFFNNCRVRVSYLVRYETRIERVCADGGAESVDGGPRRDLRSVA